MNLVAGITSARGNDIGGISVAPGAKILSIKVLDNKAPESPGGLSTFKKGLEYVRDHADELTYLT